MIIKNFLFSFFLVSILTSCASNEIPLFENDRVIKRKLEKNSFDYHLSSEYSKYFSSLSPDKKKIFISKTKEAILQEKLDVTIEDAEYFSLIRNRLLVLANSGVQNIIPRDISRLMVLYDCMISNKISTKTDISGYQCNIDFFKLLDRVDKYIKSLETINGKNDQKMGLEKFSVYFDFDKSSINKLAAKKLKNIKLELVGLKNYKLILIGNTDRVGRRQYNKTLSKKRVKNVKDFLVKNGIDNRLIKVISLGEDRPQIITLDEKKFKNNRRVDIYIIFDISNKINSLVLDQIENYIYKYQVIKIKEEISEQEVGIND